MRWRSRSATGTIVNTAPGTLGRPGLRAELMPSGTMPARVDIEVDLGEVFGPAGATSPHRRRGTAAADTPGPNLA